MEEEFRKPLLTKAILTAVFVGFVATLVCIFFNVIFVMVSIVLTAFFVWRGEHFNRSADPKLNSEFKEQVTVIVLIIGLTAAVLLPVLFHSRKFEDKVI